MSESTVGGAMERALGCALFDVNSRYKNIPTVASRPLGTLTIDLHAARRGKIPSRGYYFPAKYSRRRCPAGFNNYIGAPTPRSVSRAVDI